MERGVVFWEEQIMECHYNKPRYRNRNLCSPFHSREGYCYTPVMYPVSRLDPPTSENLVSQHFKSKVFGDTLDFYVLKQWHVKFNIDYLITVLWMPQKIVQYSESALKM